MVRKAQPRPPSKRYDSRRELRSLYQPADSKVHFVRFSKGGEKGAAGENIAEAKYLPAKKTLGCGGGAPGVAGGATGAAKRS